MSLRDAMQLPSAAVIRGASTLTLQRIWRELGPHERDVTQYAAAVQRAKARVGRELRWRKRAARGQSTSVGTP